MRVLECLVNAQCKTTGLQTAFAASASVDALVQKFVAAVKGEAVAWDEDNPPELFLKTAASAVSDELAQMDEATASELSSIAQKAAGEDAAHVVATEAFRRGLWAVFSKEAQGLALEGMLGAADAEQAAQPAIDAIRTKRKVRITTLNSQPIEDPARALLVTSNVLLTLPKQERIASLPISEASKEKLHAICKSEKQRYWYDHPIPLGVAREADELVYGLRGLEDALGFEKRRGTVDNDAALTVVLSVSVTHPSLGAIAREYLQAHIAQEHFEGLKVYVFTEDDAAEIAGSLEAVAGERGGIAQVFGVDGRYGRHYSFLKAIAALWHVCLDDAVRATFKIDLDQVFPQEALVQETSKSAFEHMSSALWGAEGVDAEGQAVHLGMVAGALVNEADIHKGLFTPDVNFPSTSALAVEDVFFPRVPFMALSTRAEMMVRYGTGAEAVLDGRRECLQRVHVTGGTNGILVDALRRYRPFTPSFIGRAEDQAYILSVHVAGDAPRLRYAHAAGFLMRHDKAAFASEAIQAAKHGTFIGDLLRTVLFSNYAKALHGDLAYAKQHFAPFTSCFMSDVPACFVMGRLVLSLARLVSQGKKEDAHAQLELASRELTRELERGGAGRLAAQYQRERTAWNAFYDALDGMEKDEATYAQQRSSIKKRIAACRVL